MSGQLVEFERINTAGVRVRSMAAPGSSPVARESLLEQPIYGQMAHARY